MCPLWPLFSGHRLYFFDRHRLFRSAAECSAPERYNTLLLRYKLIIVNDETLKIIQDGLEDTAFIYWATLSPNSRRHCHADQTVKHEKRSKEEPCLDT